MSLDARLDLYSFPRERTSLVNFGQRPVAESTLAVTAAWRHRSDAKHFGLSAEQDRAVLKQSSTTGSPGIAAARGDRNLSAAADDNQ
jgi:hypothetical protein